MLKPILAVLVICFVCFASYVICKSSVLFYRFESRYIAIINIYEKVKEERFLNPNFFSKDIFEIRYGKYKIEFSNVKEVSIELEKLIEEAIECYERITELDFEEEDLIRKEKELTSICYELRMVRWLNQ